MIERSGFWRSLASLGMTQWRVRLMRGSMDTLRVVLFCLLALSAAVVAVSCATKPAPTMPQTPATAPKMLSADILSDEDVKRLGFSFPPAPKRGQRTEDQAKLLNASCVACHTETDSDTMHQASIVLACVDCHGGNTDVKVPAGITASDLRYDIFKYRTHVQPKLKNFWKSSANPEIPGARTNQESVDYIRFVNPGDLRAAWAACYNCHQDDVRKVENSMMAHGAMLWGAALYNNGAINLKSPLYGESYTIDGTPRALVQQPAPTTQQSSQGILSVLWPLPRWEISQPGNILRVFERGGRIRPQVGIPDRLEEAGRPDVKLSLRGFGTDVRTDPVFLGLQKTRLLDPTISLFGTNDHPGDYRGSGCTSCHVVYANDRSPIHSGPWADKGNMGRTFTKDPTIPKDESGHPIAHSFQKSAPTSSCIVCHMHPGTNVVNAYLGFTWWDNETDGEVMYPKNQKYPTPRQEFEVTQHNPEGAAVRGLWSNLYPNDESHAGDVAGEMFLENLWTHTNPKLKQTQFADFHGHGWVFRAVYKQNRAGQLLDAGGNVVEDVTTEKLKQAVEFQRAKPEDRPPANVPVHLKDIHLEMGMHCTDCHFQQDNHGDGNLYGETRNAVMIECVDCHGTIEKEAVILQYKKKDEAYKRVPSRQRERKEELRTERDALLPGAFTGNAASRDPKTASETALRVISDRFELRNDMLVQKSALDSKNKTWVVKQAADSSQSTAARWAHTVRRDGKTWGDLIEKDVPMQLAHSSTHMSCYACHTSWNTSCFGCHLPMRANQAKSALHNEGQLARNYTNYNYQTLRDDVYMLGKDSSVKGGKTVPIRSACAVLVSSVDANRNWLYQQQQTVSAEGFSGQAFSPYFPHTVRTTETKQCSDCHISSTNDNTAIMAQLLLQGTNSVNFIGRYAWVAMGKKGLEAIAVAERDEPQAVIGSRLHELAFPDFYKQHLDREMELPEGHEHHGNVLDVQLRGEYLYTACGSKGFVAFDVANVDNKGFSERILTAPVSPLGQRFFVRTKYATSVCSPSTLAIDPTRPRLPENEEGPIHLIYAFLYVTDKYEGLVVIGNPLDTKRNKPGVATLLDGDPENNFLKKALSFNPDGRLNGARHMALYGHYAYISCDSGLVVVDLDNPLEPKLLETPQLAGLNGPRRVAFQFRYGFVCDSDGLKVIDVTNPREPRLVTGASVPIGDARDVYIARTYGYVAAGKEGLVIVDLTQPELPQRIDSFTGGGMDDATAVKVAMTNSSLFAYVADGHNGLKVLQLTSADDRDGTPTYMGFSPRPKPRLIAKYHTHGPALAVSEGLDRDRAVDESGNQLAVFGRKGARPFNLQEQQKLYLKKDERGNDLIYTVDDEPTTPRLKSEAPAPSTEPPATQPAPARRRR